jgi:hypothetical protein
VLKARHQPPAFTADFLGEVMDNLWEGWMRMADQVLEDEPLVELV